MEVNKMFSGNSGPSLADIAAVTGGRNNDGLGEGGALWVLIILIALLGNGENGLFGNRGNGSNGGGNGANFIPYQVGSSYTDSAIQRGFDNQAVISKLDGITNGLCDGFYNVNTSLMNGFHGVDNAICNLGYNVQQGFNTTNVALMQAQNALQTQLANCCCENREGQAQIRYDMATQACETRQAIADSTRNILDFLTQDKIATLTAENQNLKFQASQTAQNAYITANQEAQTAELVRRLGRDYPVNAVVVQPNTPVTFPVNGCGNFTGYNSCNGCGC